MSNFVPNPSRALAFDEGSHAGSLNAPSISRALVGAGVGARSAHGASRPARAATPSQRIARWALTAALAAAIGVAGGIAAQRGETAAKAQEPTAPWMRSGDVGPMVALPLLGTSGVADGAPCDARVTVQSLGRAPAHGVVVVWDALGECASCAGPARVVCTGLLSPGRAWSLGTAELGAAARSAVVLGWAADPVPCAALSAALVGSCTAWPLFLHAFGTGAPFADFALAGVAVPIAATVDRVCDGVGAFGPGHAGYVGSAKAIEEIAWSPPSMRLALPALTSGYPDMVDAAWVQNTGTECVKVTLTVKAYDDAVRVTQCTPLELAPGESARVDLDLCALQGAYAAWLDADGPIAAVVERRHQAGLAAWTATDVPDAEDMGATTLFAPLTHSEYQGWETLVYAFNADSASAAKVKVFFLDQSGDIQTTLVDWVMPLAVQVFMMPVVNVLNGDWVGSVRVESQSWQGGPATLQPAITGAVVMTRWAEHSRDTVTALVAEPLVRADRAFLYPDGAGDGGMGSGVGLLAVPEIVRIANAGRVEASVLAITNLVPVPGFTSLAVMLYDANALVDTACIRVAERSVDRIDLNHWGAIGNDFRGSALISAIVWSHDVYDANGNWQRNAVGLAASVERTDGVVADAGGDALTQVGAVPLAGPDWALLAGVLPAPCQVPTPGPTRVRPDPTVSSVPPPFNTPVAATATPSGPPPTPDPDPLRRQGAVAWLPRMAGDEAGCELSIHIVNLGAEPSKAVLITWGEPGPCGDQLAGPLKVECSGLIRPGNIWTLGGPQIPTGARSGMVVGITTRLRSQIGLTDPPDDVVADWVCENLFFGVVGDADDFMRLRTAIETGGEFDSIPMDRALAGPIAITTETRCQRDASEPDSPPLVDAAGGIPGDRLGPPNALSQRWRYDLPLLHDRPLADPAWPPSEVWLQNTGTECATVVVRWRGHADCGAPQSATYEIVPGESASFKPLLPASNWGGGWVESTQPLAVQVLVDYATGRALYNAPAAASGLADADHVAYAPLVYNGFRGWTTRLHVQNRSTAMEARVRVEILDRSGDVITTLLHAICPNGTDAIALEALGGLPSNWVGSVRLSSTRWFSASDPDAELPEIAGVVELVRRGPVGSDTADISEVATYPMLAGSASFPQPAEGDAWRADGANDGAKVLALGYMVKAGGRDLVTTEFAIANLVPKPGFTDLVLYFYDQNGLLDYVCQKLGSKQVEYIGLQTWGYINPGFKGSAIVSALWWEHDVFDAQGDWVTNLVGLGAVVLHAPATTTDPELRTTDHDGPGDVSSAWLGIPFGLGRPPGEPIFPSNIVIEPLCGGGPRPPDPTRGPPPTRSFHAYLPVAYLASPSDTEPQGATATPTDAGPVATETVRPTRTPGPTRTPIAIEDLGPSVVDVPVLITVGDVVACAPTISIQSLGDEQSKAAIVFWGAPGNCGPEASGPLKVECTGLLRPGSAWHLSGPFLPTGSQSATVYSFNVRRLSEIGVSGMADDIVADFMCENLFFGIVGDNDDFVRFHQAYLSGDDHFDVPMNHVYGAPLAVEVHRDCLAGADEAAVSVSAGYRGVGVADLGGARDGQWRYALGPLFAAGGARHSIVHIQNAGVECASVTLAGLAASDCSPIDLPSILTIAPGEAAFVDLGAAGLAGDVAAGWAEGTQPLAIAVDVVGDAGATPLLTTRGAVAQLATTGLTGGSERWYAPLTYSEYQGWETVVAVQNLDLERPAKVAVTFVDRGGAVIARYVDWLCPGGGRRFILPLVEVLDIHWVGGARVVSEAIELNGVRLPERPIAASIEAYRYDQPAGLGSIQEAFAYDMVPAAVAEGNTRLAISLVAKRPSPGSPGLDASTELVIGNTVADPGSTDLALFLFDANGLIDYVCIGLGPGMTEYIDLTSWGFVNHGFIGTAIVSAVHWTHGNGQLVGLVGATALRKGGDIGDDVPGDELSVTAAWPLSAPLPIDLGVPACPQDRPLATSTPPAMPTETPYPTPTAVSPTNTPGGPTATSTPPIPTRPPYPTATVAVPLAAP